jgi:hypothetical protein
MSLVEEYLRLVTEIVDFRTNVYDRNTAEEHNRKVERMRVIAAEIEKCYPELKNEFCRMLSHNNKDIRIWVAHHILEVINCEQNYRRLALREIRYRARADKSPYGFGEKVWLKDWYKSHPKDRWLR